MSKRSRIASAGHVVVKIGSAIFMREGGRVDRRTFAALVDDLDRLMTGGVRVTVVTSGAVALGRQALGVTPGSCEVAELQAFAALGQSRLMQMWEAEFGHYDRRVAQVLLGRQDLADRDRYLNARRALETLHAFGAVPVINENDTVATEELTFGDNDQLAAMCAALLGADLLVLLSDVEGLLEVHQGEGGERRFGKRVEEISLDDPRVDQWAGPPVSGVGRGGMVSKILAARIAARSDTPTVIAPGKAPGVLAALWRAEAVGTFFDPGQGGQVRAKKRWIDHGARAAGKLFCDEGAASAVRERGASLLPIGVTGVEGSFEAGSVVELVDPRQQVFARGLVVYDADEIRSIAGLRSEAIEEVLGFTVFDAIVHRDNLVLT
ncbi:glutamate 5-kinase [Lujinxingia litoralis]|uniref:Glutamate 5-kinase n=1 Tax=Lujinxingia litoralis TaxID=2211119 RepID=A0A328C559_9DELT|nr:glutamate 5-kinase [Lujinxingia litoralis]RAL20946.1 glutamate 5-kinase [Lujinxingia litoralis]